MNFSHGMRPWFVYLLKGLRKQRIAVPMTIWGWLLVASIQQGIVAMVRDRPEASEAALGTPPSASLLRVLSLDDALPGIKLLNSCCRLTTSNPG